METYTEQESTESNPDPAAIFRGENRCDVVDKEKTSKNESENMLPITCLPEVVLVNIMEYLSLRDCYHLSLTCKLFHNLFSHPQLWQTAHISLITHSSNNRGRNTLKSGLRSIMHKTMAEIVQRFSHLFKHLSLEIFGYVQPFDDHSRGLLEDLNKECHLESLSLKLGALTSTQETYVDYQNSNYSDLPLVVGLVKRAVRIKKISIVSWPLNVRVTGENDIFQALVDNEKIKSLKSLSLFYVEGKCDSWSERNPKLPSPEATFKLVSHFKNLTHLALRSPMLNNEIFLELASKNRSKIHLFQILIVYSKDSIFYDGYSVPEVSSKMWAALKLSSPAIKVEFLVMTRIPQDQMSLILKPDVPLSALVILKYGRCDAELIESLTEMYKNSLEKFVSLCDSSGCDQALRHLVESCTQLQHLTYHGCIHYETIIKMAEIIKERGLELNSFEFKEKHIETAEIVNDIGLDDTVVARDTEKEEYYLVGMRSWHRDEDEHHRVIDVMKDRVSRSLGYRWQPLA